MKSSWDFEMSSFQFHPGGALGHIPSSPGLFTITGQQMVSSMGSGYLLAQPGVTKELWLSHPLVEKL